MAKWTDERVLVRRRVRGYQKENLVLWLTSACGVFLERNTQTVLAYFSDCGIGSGQNSPNPDSQPSATILR